MAHKEFIMFINVVQKAQTLFKDFETREDKRLSLANPIFSWHVKYLTYRRKKVVLFAHDASTLTIVLFDINAKNRSQIKDRFEERLVEVCRENKVPQFCIDEYLKTAGDWQVEPTLNRSKLGSLNEVSMMLEMYLDDNVIDESFLSNKLSDFLRNLGSKNYTFASDIADIMQSKNFIWHEAKKVSYKKIDTSHLQDISEELKKLAITDEDYSYTTDLSKIDRKIKRFGELNNELIDSFIENVKEDYSEKTLKSYRSTLIFYLNECLAYHFMTAFQLEAASIGDLYLHGSSMTEVKRVQRSMGKFYQFLAQAGLVDADFAKKMKQSMRSDIESIDEFWY